MFLLNISAEHPSDQRNASDVFLKSLSDIVQELELRRMTSPIRCDESPDVREPFLNGDNLAARQEEHSHSHAEYHAGSISMLNRNDPFTKRSQFKEVKKFKRQLRNQSSGSRKQVSRKPKRMHAEFNLGSQNVLLCKSHYFIVLSLVFQFNIILIGTKFQLQIYHRKEIMSLLPPMGH